jgi:chromosomal replication initiation ATPase DnaA
MTSIYAIIDATADHYGMTREALTGRDKTQRPTRARQVAYAAADELGFRLARVATAFGRDHTTILDGIKRAKADPDRAEAIAQVASRAFDPASVPFRTTRRGAA